MQQPAEMPVQGYVLMGLIILVVLYFRLRGMRKVRPLEVGRLWIVPALFAALTALNLYQFPPTAGDLPWLAVAFLLGAALGWQRGRLMKIWVEPEDNRLMMQGSPWALIFLVALILIRVLLRSGLEMEAEEWAISPALINDSFIVFALGLFGVMRVEMAVRAVRLRREHAGGGAA